jgi:hypothetical protein
MNSTGTSGHLKWGQRPNFYGITDSDIELLTSSSPVILTGFCTLFLGLLMSTVFSFLLESAKSDQKDNTVISIYLTASIIFSVVLLVFLGLTIVQIIIKTKAVRRIKRQILFEGEQATGLAAKVSFEEGETDEA